MSTVEERGGGGQVRLTRRPSHQTPCLQKHQHGSWAPSLNVKASWGLLEDSGGGWQALCLLMLPTLGPSGHLLPKLKVHTRPASLMHPCTKESAKRAG